MIEFRMKDKGEYGHGMLVEFGSIEGLLAFVEENGPIAISGTIENPTIAFIEAMKESKEEDDAQ